LVRAENLLPRRVHLAFTAGAEHYTATIAERLLSDDMQKIGGDAQVWHLLNWHAMEELEHKSVAFDVYRAVGGPEWIRIGVMGVMYVVTLPAVTAGVALSILTDPSGWRPVRVTRQTWGVFRGPLLKGLMADLRNYLNPGFHPDDVDTRALLHQWQRQLFGAEGTLIGYLS
jgi:predicted metal-dependent hydrolase